MRDWLDEGLARLPAEAPAPALAGRILLAVAQRRRAQRLRQRLKALTLACAAAGSALVLSALPHVLAAAPPALREFEMNALLPALNAFLIAPVETLVAWLEAGQAWQSALSEGAGVVFLVGLALLAAAAFAGLAQLLRARSPGRYPA